MRVLSHPHPVDHALEVELDRWVAARLLSDEQSSSIREFERQRLARPSPTDDSPVPSARQRKVAPIAEALGYLGGILATVGLVLLVARYWPEMATPVRLGLSAGSAVVLLVAGAFVPEQSDPAFARLRGFLWLASTATGAMFIFVVCDGLDVAKRATVVLACAAFVATESAALWRDRPRPLQQLAALGGAVVAVGAGTAIFAGEGVVGLVVWSIGVAYLVGGLRRLTSMPLLTAAVGIVAMLQGATLAASAWQPFGLPFGVATSLALLAIAIAARVAPSGAHRRLCAVFGGLAFVGVGPATIGYFAGEAGFATGVTVWAVGSIILVLGVAGQVRVPTIVEVIGGVVLLSGAAITATQWTGFAPIFGIVTATGLIVLGMLPGRVLLSVVGSVGMLVNVPWAIGWFFPGDGRAPLLILISGALILVLAVFLSRQRGRFRREL